ncbi:MAG: DUF1573 domain-containing protein [Bacteroidia bacterium]|nr:DUF1573 domain-containing protein [Bacteroidia bacterium]
MRKSILATFIFSATLVLVATSCRDKDAEKKIAQLESRLAELEGKKPNATPTPAATAQPEQKPEGPLPKIEFAETDFDFGTISEGQKVEHVYAFKNTGEAPLIIQNAQPSCGCTVPEWSKEPIPVGGTGYVKAQFDSSGKPNAQNKSITVTANTWPKTTMLRFKAMVLPKSGGAAPADGPVKK